MTAEEFRKQFADDQGFAFSFPHQIEKMMIEFAQHKLEEALEAAADKNLSFKSKTLQRQEILNAYPKENIK